MKSGVDFSKQLHANLTLLVIVVDHHRQHQAVKVAVQRESHSTYMAKGDDKLPSVDHHFAVLEIRELHNLQQSQEQVHEVGVQSRAFVVP